MNPTSNRNMATVLVLGVAIGLAFGYFFGTAVERGEVVDIIGTAPVEGAPTQDIFAHKDALLRRVALAVPLSDTERAVVAHALLINAELYRFTDEETRRLNQALQ